MSDHNQIMLVWHGDQQPKEPTGFDLAFGFVERALATTFTSPMFSSACRRLEWVEAVAVQTNANMAAAEEKRMIGGVIG